MGIKITKEISCDCCGKQFKRERDYENHMRYVGGYTLAILASRIENEEDVQEKIKQIAHHLGIGSGSVRHAVYDDEIYNCMILAFRSDDVVENHDYDNVSEVENSSWYVSKHEVAKFLQENREEVKKMFNNMINKEIQKKEDEHRREISYLQERILNME